MWSSNSRLHNTVLNVISQSVCVCESSAFIFFHKIMNSSSIWFFWKPNVHHFHCCSSSNRMIGVCVSSALRVWIQLVFYLSPNIVSKRKALIHFFKLTYVCNTLQSNKCFPFELTWSSFVTWIYVNSQLSYSLILLFGMHFFI